MYSSETGIWYLPKYSQASCFRSLIAPSLCFRSAYSFKPTISGSTTKGSCFLGTTMGVDFPTWLTESMSCRLTSSCLFREGFTSRVVKSFYSRYMNRRIGARTRISRGVVSASQNITDLIPIGEYVLLDSFQNFLFFAILSFRLGRMTPHSWAWLHTRKVWLAVTGSETCRGHVRTG